MEGVTIGRIRQSYVIGRPGGFEKYLMPIKTSKRNKRKASNRRKGRKTPIYKSVVKHQPFFDTDLQSVAITSTAVQYTLLSGLLSASGLMQAYPQHASPYYTGVSSVRGLRQLLRFTHMELNFIVIGSQSNLITYSDMYNNVRVAVFRTGFSYSAVNPLYLTSVLAGVNMTSAKQVYHDEIISLPSLAFTTANYNSPSTKVTKRKIVLNQLVEVFSNNATGVGVPWDTNGMDFEVNFVSDSSVAPDPYISLCARIWFEYL